MGISKQFCRDALRAMTGRSTAGPTVNPCYVGLSLIKPYEYTEDQSSEYYPIFAQGNPSPTTEATFIGQLYKNLTAGESEQVWYVCTNIDSSSETTYYKWENYKLSPVPQISSGGVISQFATIVYQEPADSEYTRVQLVGGTSPTMTDPDDNGITTNSKKLYYPEAEEDWGIIRSFILTSESVIKPASPTNPSAWGNLIDDTQTPPVETTVTVSAHQVPIFPKNKLSIQLT